MRIRLAEITNVTLFLREDSKIELGFAPMVIRLGPVTMFFDNDRMGLAKLNEIIETLVACRKTCIAPVLTLEVEESTKC